MSDNLWTRRDLLNLGGTLGLASLLAAGRLSARHLLFPPVLQTPPADSPYSKRVLSLGPVGYWRLGEPKGPTAFDLSGHRHEGTYQGTPALGQPGAIRNDPNRAVGLDGSSYVEIASESAFSVGPKGLTVEAWVRPDRLNFPVSSQGPYIHWLGKGDAGHFEWGFRFYTKHSIRPNRISAYIWNAEGKEGAGAYFEETITPGQWIHVVAVYQPPAPDAGVLIYRDGEFKKGPPDTPTLYSSYNITPTRGNAPLRLGTRDKDGFLQGGLDEVAIYPRCLTAAEIRVNYRTATQKVAADS
jgi:hypothetical protein